MFVQGRLLLGALAALVFAAPASAGSLYSGAGPRPGPDILYEKPATAPQLTNDGVWRAQPILISGATAYRRGEFLYQDFLYDDHGANGIVPDPADPRLSGNTFSMPNGTYTYPTDPAYAGNAADLVEFRVKPLTDATAFRITLNTLKDPSLVAATIAIGDSAEAHELPHGANASAPAQWFVTVHGDSADMLDAATGKAAPTAPGVSVDSTRRQITVRVPHSDWNPGSDTVRLAAAVGLWDKTNDRYLIPQFSADATHPGGAGTLSKPTALFNVAFRGDEPRPDPTDLTGTAANAAWWRDSDQGQALKNGDLSPFHAYVDFGKLARGLTDDGGVPASGPMDRILASHFETEQGTDYSTTCGGSGTSSSPQLICKGELRGQLQPYAIYVPRKPQPSAGFGMTLLLHSLAANYNQYLGTRNQSQIGERGPGSIVITPEGRGPDGWYFDYAGADTFEVWADVGISGYSMGGYGTYKFATQYPDLFAKGQPVVGPPALGVWVPPAPPSGGEATNTNHMLPSLRNIPFLAWNAVADELVPYAGVVQQANTLDQLGYRYELDSFAPAEHLTLAVNDQYKPVADFLGTTRVDRNPAHVTYVVNPKMDYPEMGAPADHAYWLSGLRLRDASGDAPLGTIDVRSEGFGVADPVAGPTQHGAGALTGGTLPAIAYTSQSRQWGPVPPALQRNRLDIKAQNLSSVTIDPKRARVSCSAELNVTTDGPLTVTLAGCGRSADFGG
jgi:hypothetical protein